MADFDRFARFYDLDYNSFQDDVPFYLGLAEHTGGPLLELGCGTGRLLVPLARAGFEITGVDLSEGMLQVARGKDRWQVQGQVARLQNWGERRLGEFHLYRPI